MINVTEKLNRHYLTTSIAVLILIAALFSLAACGKKETATPAPAPVVINATDFSALPANVTGEPRAIPRQEDRRRMTELNLRFQILMQIASGEGLQTQASLQIQNIRQNILSLLGNRCHSNYPEANLQNMRRLPKGQFKFGGHRCPLEINYSTDPVEQSDRLVHVKTRAEIEIRNLELQTELGFTKAISTLEAFETTPDIDSDDKDNLHHVQNEIETRRGTKFNSEYYTRAQELTADGLKKSKLNIYQKMKLGRAEFNLQAAYAIGGTQKSDYKMAFYANGREVSEEQFARLRKSITLSSP